MTKVCEKHVEQLACFQTPELVSKGYCKFCKRLHIKKYLKTEKGRQKNKQYQANYAKKTGYKRTVDYFSKIQLNRRFMREDTFCAQLCYVLLNKYCDNHLIIKCEDFNKSAKPFTIKRRIKDGNLEVVVSIDDEVN